MGKALVALGVLVLMLAGILYFSYLGLTIGFGLEAQNLSAWVWCSLGSLGVALFGNAVIKYLVE